MRSTSADHNEEEVCAAVQKFSETMPNQGTGKVWITTKVMGHEHGTEATCKAVDDSVAIAAKYGLKWVRGPAGFQCRRLVTLGAEPDTCLFPCRDRTSSCCTTPPPAKKSGSRHGGS